MRNLIFIMIFVSSSSQAEVGFHFFDQPTPSPLTASDGSVFQLLSPAGSKQQVDIKGFTDQDIHATAVKWSENKWRPDIRIPMVEAQLQFCRQKASDLCTFTPGIGVSSAFLVREPHVLVTAFHSVEDYVELLKSTLGYSDVEVAALGLPVTLLDAQGSIVRSAWPGLKPLKLLPRILDQGLDVAVLDGAGLTAVGIPFSRTPRLVSGGTIFAIGFPGVTESRAALGKQDAKLDTLAWTTGTFTSATVLANSILMNYMYTYDLSRLPADSLFVSDLDGVGGLSGGAVLNEEGFAIGVVTNALYSHDVDSQVPEAKLPPPQAVVVANLLQALM
jgi:hypothetical protein